MRLLQFLWKEDRGRLGLTIALLLAHTLLNIALLNLIGRYTSRMLQPPVPWWGFLLLVICVVGTQTAAILLMQGIAYGTASVLRERLLTAIASARLAVLEELGKARLMAAFIDDVQRIRSSLQTIVGVARDLALVVAVLAYLAWLSPKLLATVLLVLTLGVLVFSPLRARGLRHATQHKRASDKIFELFGNFLEGVKQVRTNRALSEALRASLRDRSRDFASFGKSMGKYFTAGIQSSIILYFGLFFILSYTRIDARMGADVVPMYVLGLMLILTPLINAAFAVEQFDMASLSLSRINSLVVKLEAGEDRTVSAHGAVECEASVRKIELDNVSHSYRTSDRQEFALGPVTVTVRAGECLFIVGGNGTGKTTLLKLITGLYAPLSGEVRVNDLVIDSARRPWLREQFSTVFSEPCLFESLGGSDFDWGLSERAAPILEELRLERAIDGSKTLLAQAASCSSGERKRIAMALALLADRPIYVFDEFAADQDPVNKALFYDHFLGQLKQRGKLVIVVTHDDRYFDRADCILALERGLPPTVQHRAEGQFARSVAV